MYCQSLILWLVLKTKRLPLFFQTICKSERYDSLQEKSSYEKHIALVSSWLVCVNKTFKIEICFTLLLLRFYFVCMVYYHVALKLLVPNLVGLAGNSVADTATKYAFHPQVFDCSSRWLQITHTGSCAWIVAKSWNSETQNKLHAIEPRTKHWACLSDTWTLVTSLDE